MKESTIKHYSFDYKVHDFIESLCGDFVSRLDHEKAVAQILSKSDKESFNIPYPHPVARCRGFDGVIRADVLYPDIEKIAKLNSLFVEAEEHDKIIAYLKDQHQPSHSGISRYELFRFGPDNYKMMPFSQGRWIKYNDHTAILNDLYTNFHLENARFSDIQTYGIVTSGPNNWDIDELSREEYSESEAEFALFEEHEATMRYLEDKLIN